MNTSLRMGKSLSKASLRFKLYDPTDDVERIVALDKVAHWENRFGDIPFSAKKVRKLVETSARDEKRHGDAKMLAPCRPVAPISTRRIEVSQRRNEDLGVAGV